MRLLFVAMALFAAISGASGQGTISVTRPAGTSFSTTTGIGSNSALITHPPAPPPDFTTSHPIVGVFPYVPEPTKKRDQEDKERAAPRALPPSPYQAGNAIGRDRVESPHDAAFSRNNYFRQQEEKAQARR